jgi:hypothetical protein
MGFLDHLASKGLEFVNERYSEQSDLENVITAEAKSCQVTMTNVFITLISAD